MIKLKEHLSKFDEKGEKKQPNKKPSEGCVLFEEKTQMYQKESSVSESLTSGTREFTSPAVQLFGSCDGSETFGPQGEQLGLGPEGNPSSRVSND